MPHVASIHPATVATPLPRSFTALDAIWRALGAVARRLDSWSQARKRAAVDLDTLANMNDRDLRDIGLCRSCISAVADRMWIRDYPY